MSKLSKALAPAVKIADSFSGRIAFKVVDEQTGDCIVHNENDVMATASTIKVYCLGALLEQAGQGKISLDDTVELNAANQVRGSGILKEMTLGTRITVRDACMLMVVLSDNTATNMVIDLCGGVDAVNAHMRAHGLTASRLGGRVDFDVIREAEDLGVSTPAEFIEYLQKVRAGKVLTGPMQAEYMNFLSRQQYVDQFPRYMPYNPYAGDLHETQDIQVYNKTGFMTGVRVDVGYITCRGENITYAVFSDRCADLTFAPENEAMIAIGKIGKAVYDALWN